MDSQNVIFDGQKISDEFEKWKDDVKTETNKNKWILNKRERNRVNRKRRAKKLHSQAKQPEKVKALPTEFLEELVASETLDNTKISKRSKRKKSKIMSSLIEKGDYIPLGANVSSTDFKVVRLDKGTTNSMTENAMEFYNTQLYGKSVDRVPTKLLFSESEKIKAKNSLKKK